MSDINSLPWPPVHPDDRLVAENKRLRDELADVEARLRDAAAFAEEFDRQGPANERLFFNWLDMAMGRRDPAALEKARSEIDRALDWLFELEARP